MEQKLSRQETTLHWSRADQESSHGASAKLPTVVFIHYMWGNYKAPHRHIKMLNELGYDCVTFDLYKATSVKETLSLDFKRPFDFLYKSIVDQITDVLDSFEGDKLIFGFSGPSLCGFIACERRRDVVGYICDGGPFEGIWICTRRMFDQQTSIPSLFLRSAITTVAFAYWGMQCTAHLSEVLSRWPANIPILSIRGLKDPIVYPENIAAVFDPHPNLPLTVAGIAEAGHVDGLKKCPEEYRGIVTKFLAKL